MRIAYTATAVWLTSSDTLGMEQSIGLSVAAGGEYEEAGELLAAVRAWAAQLLGGPGSDGRLADPSGNPLEIHVELGAVLIEDDDEDDDEDPFEGAGGNDVLLYDQGPPYGQVCLHLGPKVEKGPAERAGEGPDDERVVAALKRAGEQMLAATVPNVSYDERWEELRRISPAA
jgi:hypothetical protein